MVCRFIAQYRLNKDAFEMLLLLDIVKAHLPATYIFSAMQLAVTLRFLAEGSYQKSVGNDSSESHSINCVLKVLQRHICIAKSIQKVILNRSVYIWFCLSPIFQVVKTSTHYTQCGNWCRV